MSRRPLLLLVALLAPVLTGAQDVAPAFRLPVPTGRRPIGTSSFVVPAGGAAPGAERTLPVRAWYPAADTAGLARAPYLPEAPALEAMAAFGRNPAAGALRNRGVATHAWRGAPVARIGRGLPVVVFSHGYVGLPSDYTAIAEDLASHGWAVFSVAHPGESLALPDVSPSLAFGPDNRPTPLVMGVLGEWGPEDSIAAAVTGAPDRARAEAALRWYLARIPNSTAALDRWVEDTRRTVDELERLAAPGSGSPFAGRLDLEKVAAVGHSMGGVTSAAWCARDPRCRAAVNLDGSPQYGDLLDRPMRRPMLMVYGVRPGRVGVSDVVYDRGPAYWRAVVQGALHLNFGDWQYWEGSSRLASGLGPIDPARSTLVVQSLVREFLDVALGGGPPSSFLNGRHGFPELELRRLPDRERR